MARAIHTLAVTILCAACISAGWPARCAAYSVLSHEAIIDVSWEKSLRPMLLERFPHATRDDLREAHGYVYGGAIIQDMGYYPHGSHFFSDLTHYVRSGDFVLALLRDAKTLDEYAFALGALAHYAADNDGHKIGTNRAVPILYPKLRKKFGDSVTYEDDPLAHVKTEFGFDVLEVAKQRYAPDSYHDFIGFQVAEELLARAFEETYGLELKDVLANPDKAFNSYRYGVSKLIPKATRVAWTLKKDEIQKDLPGITKKKFMYNLKRASFEKNWGKDYQPPSFGEKFLAVLFKILPKIGPLRVLQLKTPTPDTELMFENSFNATVDSYRVLLDGVHGGNLVLPNDNFDTGGETGPGKYKMNDDVHARLLDTLAKEDFSKAPREAREELIKFYGESDAAYSTKKNAKAWAKVQVQIERLKTAPPANLEKAAADVPAGRSSN
ncbi:MAG TPA: zinc dependent phospholipase C family protein [Candidatus Saccharimonadales bacterium]|nr:zinc dependent phospholipase C family protein [Candidatus Saccharimonadales bacterium]